MNEGIETIDVPAPVAYIVFTFVLAGFVKGALGLGLPTVAVGLLGLVMPPARAAALLIVPSFVTNVWQLGAGPRLRALLRRLWTMSIGICAGSWIGISLGLLTSEHAGRAKIALGLALVIYALAGLLADLIGTGPRRIVTPRAERWLSPTIGLLTGLVSGATGVFVIPAVPYLQALDFDKEELVQVLGLSFTVSTIALAIGLAQAGAFANAASSSSLSMLALAAALTGMVLGQWLRTRIRAATFRRVFFVALLSLGGHLCLG